ncbi:MFS transporter [Fluviicoccus keumensis]|uniref:MFS transporter n=1 Tax=Fluviicoccus keumensis TaxID=1435465 RepID=A0A4V2G605_9GAMM|nr:MFS transporter [Fluviicoccus keumensis]RZU46786.1 MFS transporter [Fluviicoccus keumensis]
MTASLPSRLAIIGTLYIAQGLPTGIYNQALPAILRSHGVSLQVIGFTALLALPWVLKVFWSPWVDRWHHPRLGKARSWILPLQLLCVILVSSVAMFDPERLSTTAGLTVFFLMMFLLNLLAATQDIATDGLAVRTLARHERAAGNSVQVAGYRLGLLVGGGFLLYLLGAWSWTGAFLLVSALLLLLTLPIAIYREPVSEPASTLMSSGYLSTFRDFVRVPGFKSWLGVLLTYKVADGFGSAMVKPMLVDMGFNLKQLGLQITIIGSAATIGGAVLGGWLTARWGRYPAMMAFGLLQALGLGAYACLSFGWRHGGGVEPFLVYGINALEHLATGLATVALLTVVMDHSRHQHAGADFTLQVSILAMSGGLAHLLAGFVAAQAGYTAYYLLAMTIGILLLWPVVQWGRDVERAGRAV